MKPNLWPVSVDLGVLSQVAANRCLQYWQRRCLANSSAGRLLPRAGGEMDGKGDKSAGWLYMSSKELIQREEL